MTADEEEEERRRRLETEARTKQVRVSLTRLATPQKADGTPARAEDRRRWEREEQERAERKERGDEKLALRAREIEEGKEELPGCPYCDKTFSSKWNLTKHLK